MLIKFVSIKNVGRFTNYGASGDVELKRYNLIFGENGRGKTTLCAILRSLAFGEPSHLIGRATLGASDPPSSQILTTDGLVSFRSGSWSAPGPNIAVFDHTFISENVHSGGCRAHRAPT
jgi:wobble nucleotide-excising tRNase